ncbi:MAG: hypothetical protein HY296_02490 [Thaumarchaeota archaeon]|nr:hypothetical protein [Nitrososphaerota archaeon]
MPLVFACIAPHGGELVPSLAGKELRRFGPTRKGMRVLASQIRKERPETIVLATPHNLRMPKNIGVVISENSSGKVTDGRKEVSLKAKCDLVLGGKIIEESEKLGLPVVGANFGALEGPLSDLAMDWGTLIPLWFLKKEAGLKSKLLIVTPARGIPLRQNFEFGRVVGRLAERGRKKVAFVASSDQAHAHRKDGPYGFDRRAKDYDEMVLDAVRRDRLASIMSTKPGLVEGAKPDSLWQMTMLAGLLKEAPLKGTLVSYQVPTYFGMLCASYRRSS